MHRPKRWNLAPAHPQAAELAERLRCSPLIAQVLLNRGISDPVAAADFLRPTPKLLADPALIPGLPRAAERIAQAIRDKQKIYIYGDYDVDGITASAILWHAIRQLGGNVECYIPHRVEEGYGLSAEALTQLCDDGAQLIISVDCGITAIEPAKVCAARGVDLIISDHHEWKSESKAEGRRQKAESDEEGTGYGASGTDASSSASESYPTPDTLDPLSSHPSSLILRPSLPACHTIVHPRLPGSTYPNPHLCGAGVAFKLAWGTGLAMNGGSDKVSAEFREFLVEATALAALGTIADVVPLIGENRVIAHWGLGGLKTSKLHGIQALIASANLTGQQLDSYHVGFLLAPRLNACGRMGHAREAVEMLTHATRERALEIAIYLETQNRERQATERNILAQALEQAKDLRCESDDCRAIVLGGENWHPGVIGIVASRIVDRYHRPTVMIALNNGQGQGSARSIPGFHLSRALDACTEHLESHGGHEMAAGLKIKTEKLPDFREAFCAHATSILSLDQLTPELKLESLADLPSITHALVQDLKRIGPFGHANPKPLLCCQNVTLATTPKRVGKTGDHLQLHVKQGNTTMKCIAFNTAHLLDRLKPGTVLNLAVEPQINEWNGRVSVELEVKDVQFA